MFIEANDDGSGGDNWVTGAIGRAKLQSNHHHQQTNIQFFTGRMPFLSIYTEDTLPVRQLHELRALLMFNTFNRHKDKLPSAFENYFV